MGILKYKDIEKMGDKSRQDKMKELKMELVKANVTANKTNAKTKEIKRAIARLFTFETLKAERLKKDLKNK